jgi:hypothetical protein
LRFSHFSGYRMPISERELEGGTFDVGWELPLTGLAGMSRCLAE